MHVSVHVVGVEKAGGGAVLVCLVLGGQCNW